MIFDDLSDILVHSLVAIFILYAIYYFFFKKEDSPNQFESLNREEEEQIIEQPPDDELKEMTLEELKKYIGKGENQQIFIAVKNIVFDCSKNELYREGGAYHLFAGHDASVCLSRMSFELKDLDKYDTEQLNLSEIDILEQWYQKFNSKYLRIARLITNKKDQ